MATLTNRNNLSDRALRRRFEGLGKFMAADWMPEPMADFEALLERKIDPSEKVVHLIAEADRTGIT